jgi:biopolymer transport protein ExbB
METLLRILFFGGPYMYATAFLGAVGIAIAIERTWSLVFKLNVKSTEFMSQIEKLIGVNNLDRAIKLCTAANSAALPHVIKAGLVLASEGSGDAKEAMDEAAAEVAPLLTKRLELLSGVAVITALVGLLGTSVGLFQALGSFEDTSFVHGLTLLARRASMSVCSAAVGIGMAVMLFAAKAFLSSIAARISGEIALNAIRVKKLLAKRDASGDFAD